MLFFQRKSRTEKTIPTEEEVPVEIHYNQVLERLRMHGHQPTVSRPEPAVGQDDPFASPPGLDVSAENEETKDGSFPLSGKQEAIESKKAPRFQSLREMMTQGEADTPPDPAPPEEDDGHDAVAEPENPDLAEAEPAPTEECVSLGDTEAIGAEDQEREASVSGSNDDDHPERQSEDETSNTEAELLIEDCQEAPSQNGNSLVLSLRAEAEEKRNKRSRLARMFLRSKKKPVEEAQDSPVVESVAPLLQEPSLKGPSGISADSTVPSAPPVTLSRVLPDNESGEDDVDQSSNAPEIALTSADRFDAPLNEKEPRHELAPSDPHEEEAPQGDQLQAADEEPAQPSIRPIGRILALARAENARKKLEEAATAIAEVHVEETEAVEQPEAELEPKLTEGLVPQDPAPEASNEGKDKEIADAPVEDDESSVEFEYYAVDDDEDADSDDDAADDTGDMEPVKVQAVAELEESSNQYEIDQDGSGEMEYEYFAEEDDIEPTQEQDAESLDIEANEAADSTMPATSNNAFFDQALRPLKNQLLLSKASDEPPHKVDATVLSDDEAVSSEQLGDNNDGLATSEVPFEDAGDPSPHVDELTSGESEKLDPVDEPDHALSETTEEFTRSDVPEDNTSDENRPQKEALNNALNVASSQLVRTHKAMTIGSNWVEPLSPSSVNANVNLFQRAQEKALDNTWLDTEELVDPDSAVFNFGQSENSR